MPTVQFENFLGKINGELNTALTIPPGVNSAKFVLSFDGRCVLKPRYLTRSYNKGDLKRVVWPAVSDLDVQEFDDASTAQQNAFVSIFEGMTLAPTNPAKKRKALDRANRRASDRQRMMNQVQTLLGLREALNGPRAVFVGVDLEALEVTPHPVSEVGIAVLDANDIRGIPPGPSGSNWWQFIKAHHIRVTEYVGTTNHRFVAGCPDAFDFG